MPTKDRKTRPRRGPCRPHNFQPFLYRLPPGWRLLRLQVAPLTSIIFVESCSSRFFTPFDLTRLPRLCFFWPRAGRFVRPAIDRDFIAQFPSSSVDPNIHLSFFLPDASSLISHLLASFVFRSPSVTQTNAATKEAARTAPSTT